MDHPEEMTAPERAALVAWHLAHGEELTTARVAEIARLTHNGAYRLLIGIARVIPIYQDEGLWRVCALQETC